MGGGYHYRWKHFHDDGCFNQINCALYDDECLWVVPGSHLRGDTPDEMKRFPTRPVPHPALEVKQTTEERHRLCLEYAASMPGATKLKLKAGSFCLYRNTLWHCGVYHPARVRATIHDGYMTPAFRAFTEESVKALADRKAAGLGWASYKHEFVGSTPPGGRGAIAGCRARRARL